VGHFRASECGLDEDAQAELEDWDRRPVMDVVDELGRTTRLVPRTLGLRERIGARRRWGARLVGLAPAHSFVMDGDGGRRFMIAYPFWGVLRSRLLVLVEVDGGLVTLRQRRSHPILGDDGRAELTYDVVTREGAIATVAAGWHRGTEGPWRRHVEYLTLDIAALVGPEIRAALRALPLVVPQLGIRLGSPFSGWERGGPPIGS
jgi:hypothetical protein